MFRISQKPDRPRVTFKPPQLTGETIPEGIRDLFKKSEIDLSLSLLQKITRKKGCCYGTCLTLSETIRENPGGSIQEWYEAFSPHKASVYQVLENLRGNLDKQRSQGDERAEAALMRVIAQMPKISRSLPKFRGNLIETHFFPLFDDSDRFTCIVRCWTRKKSHCFLIHSSEKHHLFYDNARKRGLYLCETANSLKQRFLKHLKTAHPAFLKRNSCWLIELPSPPQRNSQENTKWIRNNRL